MSFIQTVKIVWVIQFTLSALIILREVKDNPEALDGIDAPPFVLRLGLFLTCCFAGWYVIYFFMEQYTPFWLRHPLVWFYWEIQRPLRKRYRNFKAGFLKKQRHKLFKLKTSH